MPIEVTYDEKDDIPEQHVDLYTEQGGKWVLTGVKGLKTTEDVAKLTTALEKERAAHKVTKGKLSAWDGMDLDAVQAKLDRFDELEAAAGGTLDQAKIDEIVEKRVGAKLKAETAPLQRQIEKLTTANTALTGDVEAKSGKLRDYERKDTLRPLLTEFKVVPEHHEDVLMYAERHLTTTEDGKLVTKDGVGVTPGMTPKDWLEEMVQRKPGWLPGSRGTGASGSGVGGRGGPNPWAAENWNLTDQARYEREHGKEKAAAAAKAAGSHLGAFSPPTKRG